MAQDLKPKKVAFCIELQRQAEAALTALRHFQELSAAYIANGFQPAGAMPIVQADLDGSTVAHLNPATIQGVIGALNDIVSLAPGQYANLRKAALKPLGDRV